MTALSHTVAASALFASLAGCSTVSMKVGFDDYCQTAGLETKQPPEGLLRILLDRGEITRPAYIKRNPISVMANLSAPNIEYVDEKTGAGTRFLRHRKGQRPQVVRETDANVLIKFEPLTTGADHEVDLYGQMMTISEIPSGRLIATYRYFWTAGQLLDYCPKSKAGSLNVFAVALYAIGTRGDRYERSRLETYLPLPR
jgi:hypothetical protein